MASALCARPPSFMKGLGSGCYGHRGAEPPASYRPVGRRRDRACRSDAPINTCLETGEQAAFRDAASSTASNLVMSRVAGEGHSARKSSVKIRYVTGSKLPYSDAMITLLLPDLAILQDYSCPPLNAAN